VQYILQDMKYFLGADGRWEASRDECSDKRKPAYDYLGNGPSCGDSAAYYRGRSAGTRGLFKGVHVWSDGCGADFKCATLLLFLSSTIISFGQMWVWHWFVSCHGKTDECDAGGGALKGKLDRDELAALVTDEGFYDRALAIV
jgi:hypothetical protein